MEEMFKETLNIHPIESPSDLLPCLADVAGSLVENDFRWRFHRAIAYSAAVCGMRFEQAYASAMWRKGIVAKDPTSREPRPGASREQVEWELSNLDNADVEFMPTLAPGRLHFTDLVFHKSSLEKSPIWDRAAEGVCRAEILDVWTMFETLAGDMWVAAVNECPKPLAYLSGKPSRIKNKIKEIEDESQQPVSHKKFTIDELFSVVGTFDLSTSMGRFWRTSERVKFISLRGIRQAYSMAFNEENQEIDNILSSESLDSLAVMRNVIVHAAGRADEEYLKTLSFLPKLPKVAMRERIILTSEDVTSLVTPVVQCCTQLLNAVNKWLKTRLNGEKN